jgi:hypothetical protein
MSASNRPARMFPLRVEGDHRRLVVWEPPSLHRARGAIIIPVPAIFLGMYAFEASRGTLPGGIAGAVLYVLLFGPMLVFGLLQFVLARRRSLESVVVLDRVAGVVLCRPPAESLRLSQVAAVRMRELKKWTARGLVALDLIGIDGLLLTVMYRRLPVAYWTDTTRVVDVINTWLRGESVGVPAELGARRASERSVLDERIAPDTS